MNLNEKSEIMCASKMKLNVRETININMNSKLAGTTMNKISLEGVVALKRAGLVLTSPTVYSARLQEKLKEIECINSSKYALVLV